MTADGRPDISVVVMAYNERVTLGDVVSELRAELDRLGRAWEIVIVDDGSSDGTEHEALRLAEAAGGVRTVRHPANRGLGGVYRTGFAEARGHHVTFYPADGQFPAALLADFRAAIAEADLVLGYLPQRPAALVGRALSALERAAYRVLVGPMPRFQGVMMYRREVMESMTLHSDGRGWGVVMEFVLRTARGPWRVRSIPTTVRPRAVGRSKVNNLRTITANLRQLLTLRAVLARGRSSSVAG